MVIIKSGLEQNRNRRDNFDKNAIESAAPQVQFTMCYNDN